MEYEIVEWHELPTPTTEKVGIELLIRRSLVESGKGKVGKFDEFKRKYARPAHVWDEKYGCYFSLKDALGHEHGLKIINTLERATQRGRSHLAFSVKIVDLNCRYQR